VASRQSLGVIFAEDPSACADDGASWTAPMWPAGRRWPGCCGRATPGTHLIVEPNWELQLQSRTEFVGRWLWHVGYPRNSNDPVTIVICNALFDFSRTAVESPKPGLTFMADSPSPFGKTIRDVQCRGGSD
jgi:hypothetical protein